MGALHLNIGAHFPEELMVAADAHPRDRASATPGDHAIALMISRLMAASSFEDAATVLLDAMLALADARLAGGAYAWSGPTAAGRLLRGVVHLRPEAGYQQIFGIEHPSGASVEGTGYLTSANVWRWVEEHRCSVSVDVRLGTIYPWLTEPAAGRDGDRRAEHEARRGPPSGAGRPSDATRERMLDRDATHVHVVPLRAPSGGILGMVTLEVSCMAATGDELLWEAACEPLALLASVSAPYLAALPSRPAAPAPRTDAFLPVVGSTTSSLVDLLCIFAKQEETILLSGPTGAGKSRLARYCHEQSSRRGQPFETLDLLGVPEELQQAELFGWRRGAFTGAVTDSAGALGRAAHGTLFIDEIDKLSLGAQASLLRVLEARLYRPLGHQGLDCRADVRFIVATNVDLRATVRAGRFREDLFYRINVLPVRVPPLSERLDELPAWAEHIVQRLHQGKGREGAARLAPEAVKLLLATPLPGNIRQLDTIVVRAYAFADNDRGAGALVIERRHIERALAQDGVAADSGPLLAHLWRAAQTFVQEAERRGDAGATLSLDACDALRGLVLAAAVLRRGRDEAFVLLGQAPLLKNRNHHRALRRELEKARALIRLLGSDPERDLEALLAEEDDAEEDGEEQESGRTSRPRVRHKGATKP